MDVTSNPTLMLDFNCGIKGIPMIDLTKDKIEVHYPPHQGNIADDPEDDVEMPTTVPGPSTHQRTAHGESSKTSALPADKQWFSPQPTGRLEALMSKENQTQILIKVGTEETSTHFDAHVSQDEASYDGDVSNAEEDDIKVVPDKVDDTQIEGSKPVEAIPTENKEVPETTNKDDGGQTSKSVDKNSARQHSNKASSGT